MEAHSHLVWFIFGNLGSNGAVDSSSGVGNFFEAMTATEGIAVLRNPANNKPALPKPGLEHILHSCDNLGCRILYFNKYENSY